jgi:hypothetical protein
LIEATLDGVNRTASFVPVALPVGSALYEKDTASHTLSNGQFLVTANQRQVINVGRTSDGQTFKIKVLDPFAVTPWSVLADFQVSIDPEDVGAPLGAVFADDTNLYALEDGGEARMFVFNIDQERLVATYRTDQYPRYANGPETRELGGFIDTVNKVAFISEKTADSGSGMNAPASDSGAYVHQYACVDTSDLACTSDAECGQCGLGRSQCLEGLCTPVIQEVTPSPIGVGGYLTVKGCYLGATGQVYFTNKSGVINTTCEESTDAQTKLDEQCAVGITPEIAICGITKQSNSWLIEVPQEDTAEDDDDAFTGHIRLRRTDGGQIVEVETTGVPYANATQVQIESQAPFYSFNVTPLTVDSNVILPYICSYVPDAGDPQSVTSVRGKNFGEVQEATDQVAFYGTVAAADDFIATTVECTPGAGDAWSDTQICVEVPQDAVTGPIEVTNNGVESKNKLDFTVYEIQKGPLRVSTPSVSPNAQNTCTNAVIEVGFDQIIDTREDISGDVQLLACSQPTTFAKVKTFFANVWQSVKNVFTHSANAQYTAGVVNCTDVVSSQVSMREVNGGTVIRLTPQEVLQPNELYRVRVSENLTNVAGVHLNHQMSESGLESRNPDHIGTITTGTATIEGDGTSTLTIASSEGVVVGDIVILTATQEALYVTDVVGDAVTVLRGYFGGFTQEILDGATFVKDSGFTFATRGNQDPDAFDPGVCRFEDVQVSVYNDSTGTGKVSQRDFFLCAGENCRLAFDHDQAPGPLGGPSFGGNQHRYVATGISQTTTAVNFQDRFERGPVNLGDNSYVAFDADQDCTNAYTLANGELLRNGNVGCDALVAADLINKDQHRIFAQGAPFTASVELRSVGAGIPEGAGVVMGGNTITLRDAGLDSNGNRVVQYVATDGNTQIDESFEVSGPGAFSRWDVAYLDGILTLSVDGSQVLPRPNQTVFFPQDGRFGFVATAPVSFDDFFVTIQDTNILKGSYTWSRNQALDPLQLVTLHPTQNENAVAPTLDEVPADDTRVRNGSGNVYVSVNPVATGQTKVIVEATTDGGQFSNTVAKEVAINIFICENPWPNISEISSNPAFIQDGQFVDQTYNFMTRYCRDIGDATNPADNLPAATIIENTN